LSVVLHLSVSVSAARNTTRLANKSLRVPLKKVRDEIRARGLRANFAHLITRTLGHVRSRLALKVEGLARVSKNAGGRPRLASVAFDGRYMGLAL